MQSMWSGTFQLEVTDCLKFSLSRNGHENVARLGSTASQPASIVVLSTVTALSFACLVTGTQSWSSSARSRQEVSHRDVQNFIFIYEAIIYKRYMNSQVNSGCGQFRQKGVGLGRLYTTWVTQTRKASLSSNLTSRSRVSDIFITQKQMYNLEQFQIY